MSVIDIQRSHQLTQQQARAAAERVAIELDQKFGLEHRWEGETLHFQRTGLNGHLEVGKDQVHVHMQLGFLLCSFQSRLEHEIQRYLDKLFGITAP